jgi:hypothetical protein
MGKVILQIEHLTDNVVNLRDLLKFGLNETFVHGEIC